MSDIIININEETPNLIDIPDETSNLIDIPDETPNLIDVNEEICTICLENLNDNHTKILPCKHILHHDCYVNLILHSFTNNTNVTCPICRHVIINNYLHNNINNRLNIRNIQNIQNTSRHNTLLRVSVNAVFVVVFLLYISFKANII